MCYTLRVDILSLNNSLLPLFYNFNYFFTLMKIINISIFKWYYPSIFLVNYFCF